MNLIKLNLYNLSRKTANIGLIILFPGFFIYHFAIASQWIPAFAGGLFGSVSLFLAVMFILLLPWIFLVYLRGVMMPSFLFLSIILYISAISILHFCFGMDQIYIIDALQETAAILILWMALFYVGVFVSFTNSHLKVALIISLILICLLIAISAVNSDSLVNSFLALLASSDEGVHATYQGMSRSVFIIFVFLVSIISKAYYRAALFIIGIILLFFIGARTEFVGFLFLCAVFMFLPSEKKATSFLTRLAVLFFLGLIYITFGEYIELTRHSELLDISQSGSWQERQLLLQIAIKTISQNIIIGDYGYGFRDDVGYAHNGLSAWAEYGLFGFVLYAGLLCYCTWISIREILFKRNMTPEWMVAFSINITSFVLVIFALHISSPVPALGWGLTVNALLQKHKRSLACVY